MEVDGWAWHDVLYALWCLGDVERVEVLEQRLARVEQALLWPATKGGAENLTAEHRALFHELRQNRSIDAATLDPDVIMRRFTEDLAASAKRQGPRNVKVN